MTDMMKISKSETFRDFDFCLISTTDSMAYLAGRLQALGRHVTGMGPRQAPTTFSSKCDSFVYMDPANRYELLMDEGLVSRVYARIDRKRGTHACTHETDVSAHVSAHEYNVYD